MKTSNFVLKTLALLMIGGLVTIFSPAEANAQQKADLRISKVSTIGPAYKGSCNKVRAMVTNSQRVGVNKKIPVILFVSQGGAQPTSYLTYIKGIGPSDNYGQPAVFKNVNFSGGNGKITLRAVVNPDQEILETVYHNNDRIQKINAPRRTCGGGGGHAGGGQGYKLKVYTYKQGTWNGQGSGQDVAGAYVKITKSGQHYTGTTDSQGYVTIPNIPKGMVNIKVSKNGCSDTSQKNYMMAAHNYGKVNMDINCN